MYWSVVVRVTEGIRETFFPEPPTYTVGLGKDGQTVSPGAHSPAQGTGPSGTDRSTGHGADRQQPGPEVVGALS